MLKSPKPVRSIIAYSLVSILALGGALTPALARVDLPDVAPLPTSKNAASVPGGDDPGTGSVAPSVEAVPLPEPKPDMPSPSRSAALPDGGVAVKGFLPDQRAHDRPVTGSMPDAERSCRQRLQELGAEFENRPAETDPAGCSIPYPLVLETLGSGIALAPAAVMNCTMAEAAVRFARRVALPAARDEFGEGLSGISQASAYVCRPRNGTRKLSEHAFGNALDIASFTLADGRVVAVEPEPDAKAARFLDSVRDSACGLFKTVLGPGSDADHATHFHLDLQPRRNAGTFCQ